MGETFMGRKVVRQSGARILPPKGFKREFALPVGVASIRTFGAARAVIANRAGTSEPIVRNLPKEEILRVGQRTLKNIEKGKLTASPEEISMIEDAVQFLKDFIGGGK